MSISEEVYGTECQGDHRTNLHEAVQPPAKNPSTVLCSGVGSRPKMDYECDILIKVVPLTVHGHSGILETYGVLDDCLERTI